MSQNRFETRLVLEPALSRYLLIYLLLVHGLALLALWQPLQLDDWMRLLLVLGIVSSFAWSLYRYIVMPPMQLIWQVDNNWTCHSPGRDHDYLALLPDSFVTRVLIVLHFRSDRGESFRVTLLPDSLSRSQWHRLWLRLKFADFD